MAQAPVIIIGAGIGGLAAALRLAHAGVPVTVMERHAAPGGKMRTVPSESGPIDAGPTVLTMRPVFEELFESVGERLSDHLTLMPLDILARHYWADGTKLDLYADHDQSKQAVIDAFGRRTADAFVRFSQKAKRLFHAFDAPMMQHDRPTQLGLAAEVMRQPRLIADMAPHRTLHTALRAQLREPKLVQLFGRYATYVGGSPFASPAILALIWEAEAAGVWSVKGGMHRLAATLEALAKARGAVFLYNSDVTGITKQGGRVTHVETSTETFPAAQVLFNGEPRALAAGLLGTTAASAVTEAAADPRSLSAHVMSFDAVPSGPPLAHHTVFFANSEQAEFDALARGETPTDATLYICAQDYPTPATTRQRFEIIRNAPPNLPKSHEEEAQCLTAIHDRLAQFGLHFSPKPNVSALTAPMDFDRMFPGSQGSLYGRSPHGFTAALKRPTARTSVRGLYLCGGGVHPGAGVPMATLSGKHAAAAILSDRTSTSTSHQTATRGGMSTA